MALLEQQDYLDLLVLLAFQDLLVCRDPMVLLAPQDPWVQLDLLEQQDHKVRRVRKEMLVQWDLRVL